jgi:chloramphenicol 3-O phosphotransferase
MTPGTILILNGASSAGKSSLLKAVQATMEQPYLDAGLDRFLRMLPKRYLSEPALWQQVMEPTRSGPLGLQLIAGMHQSIAALARMGNHVVADHVLVDRHWLLDAARTFCALPAYLIGVRCPLGVLEQRERDRKDRTQGQAASQFHLVHAHALYDFEVDTAAMTPEECAAQIKGFLDAHPTPWAFKRLGKQFTDEAGD